VSIQTRAREAKDLQENPVFCAILQEITDSALLLFANAQSDMVAISAAHEKIRAVQLIRDALTARIDAAKFEDHKKDRDRG
jgi:hypothetical protein